jgi:hypothetical protein
MAISSSVHTRPGLRAHTTGRPAHELEVAVQGVRGFDPIGDFLAHVEQSGAVDDDKVIAVEKKSLSGEGDDDAVYSPSFSFHDDLLRLIR